MKKAKCLFVALLSVAGMSFAQAQANFGEFKWGLKGGVNFASMNNLGIVEKDKTFVGPTGGGFCKIPLKHFVSIRPELLFSMKGATLDVPTDVIGLRDRGRIRTGYVEVPLSLDFDLPYFLDFHTGVQGALLVFKKMEINGAKQDNSDNFNNTEFGWHIGGGIDLGNIGIHVRYQQSLTSFFDGPISAIRQFEPRNWGLSLSASYMLVH